MFFPPNDTVTFWKGGRASESFHLLNQLGINHFTHCDSCMRLSYKVPLTLRCLHDRDGSSLSSSNQKSGYLLAGSVASGDCEETCPRFCPRFLCGFWECAGKLWHSWAAALCFYRHVKFSLYVLQTSHLYNDTGHVGTGYLYDFISTNYICNSLVPI